MSLHNFPQHFPKPMLIIKDKLEIILSMINVALTTVFGIKYFYGNAYLIVIVSLSLLATILKPVASWSDGYSRVINAFYFLTKIFLIAGLFIITNNLFVMRIGFKNCRSCDEMSSGGIIVSSFVFAYYLVYGTYNILVCKIDKKKY